MARLLQHDGDAGQPSGTVITAANSASPGNNRFDSVTQSANATLVWDTAHALPLRGECIRVATGATAGSAFCQWGGDPGLGVSLANWGSVFYWRGYVWLPALPNVAVNIMALQAFSGATIRARLRIRTDGTVAILGSTSTELAVTTNPVPVGQWVRIEAKFTLGLGDGVTTVGFYLGEATTNNVGDNVTASAINNAATTIDQIRQGVAVSVTGFNGLYTGGFALSDTVQPGPISGQNNVQVYNGAVVPGTGLAFVSGSEVPANVEGYVG